MLQTLFYDIEHNHIFVERVVKILRQKETSTFNIDEIFLNIRKN
jgi:hypothetical protein